MLRRVASSRCGFKPVELQAHIWYFIASAGYVSYDIMYGYVPTYCSTASCIAFTAAAAPSSNFLTVFWAVCYMIDAFFYFFAPYVHEKDYMRVPRNFYAELGNVTSSALYLASQCIYFIPEFNTPTTFLNFCNVAYLQAAMYFISCSVWAFNSLQYMYCYMQEAKDPQRKFKGSVVYYLSDIYFWAEVFNVLPSFGYMFTSLWALAVMPPQSAIAPSMENLTTPLTASGYFSAFVYANQTFQLLINIAWDVMFTLDAILFAVIWWKEGSEARLSDKEMELGQPLIGSEWR